ncbi:3-dehydroquinate synthase [Ulvibacterium sp.]|uniref:3-dehydroquinate synthase n=1 Tax=Ulvibacterium sp. TaxID=2665914 RepID=UPI003BAAB328
MHLRSIEQSFTVTYTYKLHFTQKLFGTHNTLFRDVFEGYKKNGRVKAFFVIDKGVHEHHPDLDREIKDYCIAYPDTIQYTGSLIIEGGEQCKNDPGNVTSILEKINTNSICRHSFVVVIGGGAIIDMVGYAAAIAHRGVKLIRVPTTVLSQNDSAVGVKNSVNSFGKKNFVGTFAPPYAIINDTDFLKTLEHRDWIAGIAEAIKVALIKDKKFFAYLEDNTQKLRNRDMAAMQYVIHKCAEMHMAHIAQGGDPFESGSSRPLDFGHWAAHKLEQMSNYGLRHGEAVAKGIALDITYAQLIGLISEDTQNNVLDVMQKTGLDLHIPVETEKEIQELLQGIEEFREHLGGELCITLISEIGEKHDVNKIDLDLMQRAITGLNDSCKIRIE